MFAEYHGQIDFILYIWYNIKDIVSNRDKTIGLLRSPTLGVEGCGLSSKGSDPLLMFFSALGWYLVNLTRYQPLFYARESR